jgi:transcriptional regulator with XRE-family HTH domain
MSKITPRRAKNVDPEHFMEFKKNAQFVLDRGRSQRDMAELLGISEANLSKYLYGKVRFPVTYAFINRFSSIFRNVTQLRKLTPAEQETFLEATNEEGLDFTIDEKLDSIREDLNEVRRDVAFLKDAYKGSTSTRDQHE